jgi:hypothetical protein
MFLCIAILDEGAVLLWAFTLIGTILGILPSSVTYLALYLIIILFLDPSLDLPEADYFVLFCCYDCPLENLGGSNSIYWDLLLFKGGWSISSYDYISINPSPWFVGELLPNPNVYKPPSDLLLVPPLVFAIVSILGVLISY